MDDGYALAPMHTSLPSRFDPHLLTGAGDLLSRYDVLFCDIWGVLHDGIRAFDASNAALQRFRAGGGRVVLVSNAPSPLSGVEATLAEKGVARAAWDAIVSSGELALAHITEHDYRHIHRIGPAGRDSAFFTALGLPDTPLDAADAIACTGLVDDRTETGATYRARLAAPAARRIPFVCANPDLVVHVGDTLYLCAGTVAAEYQALGGPVVWCGKPYPGAYARAFEKAAILHGGAVPPHRVLAIGDAVRTDLAGAARAGIDALFITGGIHRDEVMRTGTIDPAALRDTLAGAGIGALAAMPALAW